VTNRVTHVATSTYTKSLKVFAKICTSCFCSILDSFSHSTDGMNILCNKFILPLKKNVFIFSVIMNQFGVPPCAKVLFILKKKKKGCNTLINVKTQSYFCFHLCTYLSRLSLITLYIARLIEGIFISKQSTVLQYSFNALHCLKLLHKL